MRSKLLALLDAIDRDIASGALFNGQPQKLYIIGAAAIVLSYDTAISTLDIDITDNDRSTVRKLKDLYGKSSDAPEKFGVYIDFMNEAQTLLPSRQQYTARARRVRHHAWERIEVFCVEPTDLIISKLKRFHAGDRRDIRFLVDNAGTDVACHELEQRLSSLEMYEFEDFDRYRARLDVVLKYIDGRSDEI